jgi:hypothetical protein
MWAKASLSALAYMAAVSVAIAVGNQFLAVVLTTPGFFVVWPWRGGLMALVLGACVNVVVAAVIAVILRKRSAVTRTLRRRPPTSTRLG